jgi:transcription elongation factor GreA
MNSQYLSPERLEELKNELNELKTVKRIEIAERLKTAKDYGDLSENAEYSEARDEQAKVEGRIIELQEVVKSAVTTRLECGAVVHPGCAVTVKKNGDTLKYFIVGTYEANPLERKISDESPLGKAFMGKKVGDLITVTIPAGSFTFEILKIE